MTIEKYFWTIWGMSCNCSELQDFQSTGATLVGGIILLRQIESDAGRCIRPYGCQSSPGRKSWQNEENVTARTKRSSAQKGWERGRERESGWNGNWKRGAVGIWRDKGAISGLLPFPVSLSIPFHLSSFIILALYISSEWEVEEFPRRRGWERDGMGRGRQGWGR